MEVFKKQYKTCKERHVGESDTDSANTRGSKSWSPATVIILLVINKVSEFTGLAGACMHDRWQLFWHVQGK